MDLMTAMTSADSRTENGALTNSTSGNYVLDFFSRVGAMRNAPESQIQETFTKAFLENPRDAMKILFYGRDIRGGQGERRLFRTLIRHLAEVEPEALTKNLHLIPEYGRWDDFFCIYGTSVWHLVRVFYMYHLNHAISGLAAKYSPRESSQYSYIAKDFIAHMGLTPKQYRKMLVEQTRVVEQQMCAREWEQIEYSHVPSVAMRNYRKAFEVHDDHRFAKYLTAVEKGETKINASTLYPHDIVGKLLDPYFLTIRMGRTNSEVQSLCLQWNALPNYMEGNPYRVLPVVDCSGSMYDGKPRWIDVAVSLGLYISERNIGPFKDHFVAFSMEPKVYRVVGNTIAERLQSMLGYPPGFNTDLQAVFRNILSHAVKYNVAPEEMPNMVLLLSDMEFDSCGYHATSLEAIHNQYLHAGYDIPNIVFWNIAARGNDNVPVKQHQSGAALVSGYSPSILKTILSGTQVTPNQIMRDVLDSPRYSAVSI